jgi:hypothetical protein
MNRQFNTLTVGSAPEPPTNVSALPVSVGVFGIVVIFAAFLWTVAIAPTFVSFALTTAVATAWCAWLDRHPERSVDGERRAHLA